MERITRTHALAFMIICLLVAAILRFHDLPGTPPGVHFDEAANGVLAGDIAWRGDCPVFISSYTGKEPLFFYLAAGLMRLLGETTFALRLTAAFAGLLTIAAAYWLGCELLADRRLALLAAALLTVSFWHLLFSHLGFRAITQPLFQALAVAALFRGVRRGEWPWLVGGGLALGLTAYTYLAARLFPVLLLLALIPVLWNTTRPERGRVPRRWRQIALFGLVGMVTLAPLLAYFGTHPEAFWVRIAQVGPGTAELSLGESILRSLAMLFLQGDPYIRFNLPGRPLFDWFWGSLLLVGWAISARQLSVARRDWQRSALLLLLLAPLIMLLPTALATGEIVPSNLRAIGLIPFVFYLPPIGLLALLQSVAEWAERPLVTPAAFGIGAVVLLLNGIAAQRLYYRAWGNAPELFYETDGDMTAVARYLDETAVAGKTLYVASPHYQHPTLAFLSDKYDAIKWLPDSRALVFPPEMPALYIFPHKSPLPAWAEPYLQAGLPGSRPANPAPFTAVELAATPPLTIPHRVDVNFGNAITLLGYSAQTGRPGGVVPLTLFWQVEGTPDADYTPFVHLEDQWGYRWSQAETFAYPAPQWTPGEVIVQRVETPVPAGTPPGGYRLRIGLFRPGSGERLPRLDEDGRYAGDAFPLEFVGVLAGDPPDEIPQPDHPLNHAVRPGLRLLGYERSSDVVRTGETLPLSLWWLATEPQPPLTIRLEMLRPDNGGRILLNTRPVHDTYPFPQWPASHFLIDRIDPRLPDRFPSGEYRLQLRILDAGDNSIFTANLGMVEVEKTERLFTAPDVEYPLNATFSQEIALLGYDLAWGEAGETAVLRLVWQARQTPTDDYTVFVHLLRPDGVCCAWQTDVMPQQNQYPTSRWQPGEVVVDTYQIEVPPDAQPGAYPLEIGLYMAETGRRLQVKQPPLHPDDAVYLRPLQIE